MTLQPPMCYPCPYKASGIGDVIIGPADSPYGAVFVFDGAHSYPFGAPSIKFITPILHRHRRSTGKCVDILGSSEAPNFKVAA